MRDHRERRRKHLGKMSLVSFYLEKLPKRKYKCQIGKTVFWYKPGIEICSNRCNMSIFFLSKIDLTYFYYANIHLCYVKVFVATKGFLYNLDSLKAWMCFFIII